MSRWIHSHSRNAHTGLDYSLVISWLATPIKFKKWESIIQKLDSPNKWICLIVIYISRQTSFYLEDLGPSGVQWPGNCPWILQIIDRWWKLIMDDYRWIILSKYKRTPGNICTHTNTATSRCKDDGKTRIRTRPDLEPAFCSTGSGRSFDDWFKIRTNHPSTNYSPR